MKKSLNEFTYDKDKMEFVDHVIDSGTHKLRRATEEDILSKAPTKKYAVWKNTNKIVSDDDDELKQCKTKDGSDSVESKREQIVNITTSPDEGLDIIDANIEEESDKPVDTVSKDDLKLAMDELKQWFKLNVKTLIDKKIAKNEEKKAKKAEKDESKKEMDYVISLLKETPLVKGALLKKYELDERAKRTNKLLGRSSDDVKKKIFVNNIDVELGETDDSDLGEYKTVKDLYYPERIGGLSREDEMTVSDAFNCCKTTNASSDIACTVAYEARLRGYDVTATQEVSKSAEHLTKCINDAWINLETGKAPRPIFDSTVKHPDSAYSFLAKNIKKGNRYVLCCGYADETESKIGVMIADKNSSSLVRIIDLQNRVIRVGKSPVKEYCLNEIDFAKRYLLPVSKDDDKQESSYGAFCLVRIDDCAFNPYYVTDSLLVSNKDEEDDMNGRVPDFEPETEPEVDVEEPSDDEMIEKPEDGEDKEQIDAPVEEPSDDSQETEEPEETDSEEDSDDSDSEDDSEEDSDTEEDSEEDNTDEEPDDEEDSESSEKTSKEKKSNDSDSEEDSDEEDDIDALIDKLYS